MTNALARGVYIAPWRHPRTLHPVVVLIDCRGCCIHEMALEDGESEAAAIARAEALLQLIDVQAGP